MARAKADNEAMAHVLMGLSRYPLDERLAIARHMARSTGLIAAAAIALDDVSDAGLRRHLAACLSIERRLDAALTSLMPNRANRTHLSSGAF